MINDCHLWVWVYGFAYRFTRFLATLSTSPIDNVFHKATYRGKWKIFAIYSIEVDRVLARFRVGCRLFYLINVELLFAFE